MASPSHDTPAPTPALTLFPYFADGAVLPRDREIPVWGTAPDPFPLTLRLVRKDGVDTAVTADWSTDGDVATFRAKWPPQAPGEGLTLLAEREGTPLLTLRDLAVGDVFLLAGQSNMELPMSRCLDAMPPRFTSMTTSKIRELRLAIAPSFDTQNTAWPASTGWRGISPATLPELGALGIATADVYRQTVDVPVGLINMAAGGTPIEAWLPHDALEEATDLVDTFRLYRDPDVRLAYDQFAAKRLGAWFRDLATREADVTARENLPWVALRDFPMMFFGTPWENRPGAYRLRCRFDLTDDMYRRFSDAATQGELHVDLGTLVDQDETFLNGVRLGDTGYRYPPRRYLIPPDALREGTQELLIRLLVHEGTGGAVPDKPYRLTSPDATLDLTDPALASWDVLPVADAPALPPSLVWNYMAGTNYYAYVQPLGDFPVTAILWYQGESNDARPEHYGLHFRRLIRHYRSLFGDVPFVYVMLPYYDDPARRTPGDVWAKLREAQASALALPDTALIDARDAGELNDLHPRDKWTLGRRMAAALVRLLHGDRAPLGDADTSHIFYALPEDPSTLR